MIWRHAFRNIRVQLVTIVALAYGGLLEGAVLIETVFAWPGFGQYLTNNMLLGDMNAVMACVLIVGVIFIAPQPALRPALPGLRPEDTLMTAVQPPMPAAPVDCRAGRARRQACCSGSATALRRLAAQPARRPSGSW